jgi:acetylornithine deacetylase/succinyl-diaminopimelate desuccinylase-like protein
MKRRLFHWMTGAALSAALSTALSAALSTAGAHAQPLDWDALNEETLQHFQTLVRFDTSHPPGIEKELSDYLVSVLEAEGIEVKTFALEAPRPNVVARLRGNGSKRPLLLMAHLDTVTVDPAKWRFPPFSATRDEGWIYGRGTVDDKDNVAAALMTMLLLKRQGVELDRDVIFLAESGEEGATHVGIEFMINQHFDEIDAEFCIAEGASVVRQSGSVHYAAVQTVEKLPRAVELTSTGISGHGSVPLQSNAIVHLSQAVVTIAAWQPPVRLSDTTAAYFSRLAAISAPAEAERYRAVLNPGSEAGVAALEYFKQHEPSHAAILHSTISPNIIAGGYRVNVIPSEAKATLDVRLLPDENPAQFLEAIRQVINDPAVNVSWAPRNERPGASVRLDTEAFRVIEAVMEEHYDAPVLPVMSTGATDMSYLRARGVQCYGIGPGIDAEDGPLGFGAHSDQERIIEAELYRFVQVHYDIVRRLAAAP